MQRVERRERMPDVKRAFVTAGEKLRGFSHTVSTSSGPLSEEARGMARDLDDLVRNALTPLLQAVGKEHGKVGVHLMPTLIAVLHAQSDVVCERLEHEAIALQKQEHHATSRY